MTGWELLDKIVNHGRMIEREARRYFHRLINVVDYCNSRIVLSQRPEGYLPFDDPNLMELLKKISSAEFTFPRGFL
ncbi:putative non-specific serine/threonine protein kinase [Medicago truncatula]|uniref:CBL-interacting kinase, putative n=1 Tax=Medicago truncatula TaxID=3880 RepID=G7K1R0_MEDTR|nr:CBL-interacting kinase, putative [Medicago truncatula]KEH37460.1 CBL-interacting kinase, putative [Medicago truncatula]RHN56924.1 putative non-specific serine/threonine protein kinase [Medicago truncatula]